MADLHNIVATNVSIRYILAIELFLPVAIGAC